LYYNLFERKTALGRPSHQIFKQIGLIPANSYSTVNYNIALLTFVLPYRWFELW